MNDAKTRDRPAVARQWWARLADRDNGDRASLARLRRAATPAEVYAVAEAAELARRLDAGPDAHPDRLERIAILAHVLAHVREDAVIAGGDSYGFTRALGARVGNDDPPLYSEIRMARLVRPADAQDLMNQLRRAVAILGGRVDVASLARFVLAADNAGERARALLAYHDPKPAKTDAPAA